jgi:hypothetical protein
MMALIMAIVVTLSAVSSLQLFGYERVRAHTERLSREGVQDCVTFVRLATLERTLRK